MKLSTDLTARRFGVCLAVVIAILFWDVLLAINTFFFRDYALFGYPLAAWHRSSFWNGEIPLWNPYNNCGLPFLAQWNTLVFYPGSIIYLLLPLPWSLGIYSLFHYWLGGLGMFKLVERWTGHRGAAAVAATAFCFNGLLLSSLKWPNNMAAFGLMPWVVLTAQSGWLKGGRKLAIASLVGGTQMLSGAPEVIILTWILVFALVLLEIRNQEKWLIILRFGMIVVLTASLAAVTLLPFLDLLRHSQRQTSFDGSMWSMPPWGWINFLLPNFQSFPSHQGVFAQKNQYWVSSYYSGAAVLCLAGIAVLRGGKLPRYLALLCLLTIVLAFGNAGLLYPVVQKVVPIFAFMRFPIKFVSLAAFLLAILSGFGFARLVECSSPKNWSMLAGFMTAILIGAALSGDGTNLFQNAAVRILFLASVTLLLWLRKPIALSLGFAALIVADVITHTAWQNPTAQTWLLKPGVADLKPPPTLGRDRALISPEAEYRLDHLLFSNPTDDVLSTRLSLFCNANLIDQIPKVNGFYSLYLKPEAEVEVLIYGQTNMPAAPLLRFLSVSQVSAPGKTISWQPFANSLPWLTGGQAVQFADERERLEVMASPAWDPAKIALISSSDLPKLKNTNFVQVSITNTVVSPHRVACEVDAAAPAILVLNQAFYHCWKAAVDGIATEILPVNHAFQAVSIPQGRHRVEFHYDDLAFRLGGIISGVTLLGAIGFLMVRRNEL